MDIDNYLPGDKDNNIRDLIGDEFVGLSTTDNTPSSFHVALNEKYQKMSEEEKEMVDTVQNVRNVSIMPDDELKEALKDRGISFNNLSTLDMKLKLIQEMTGIDMHDPAELTKLNDTFETYLKRQIELEGENIRLSKNHQKTTEESIPYRSDEGKKTYEDEAELHKRRVAEEVINKSRDEHYLSSISQVRSIISTKQNMIYAQRVAQTNETISRDINGIKVNEEFTPSEEVYETIQNTQEEYER